MFGDVFAVSLVFSKTSRQYILEAVFCLCPFVNPSCHLSMSLVFNAVRGTLESPSSVLYVVSLVICPVPVPSRAFAGIVNSPVMWPGSVCGPGASLVLRHSFLFLHRLILLLFLVLFQFLMFLLCSILLLFVTLRMLRTCPLSPRTVLNCLHLILSLMFLSITFEDLPRRPRVKHVKRLSAPTTAFPFSAPKVPVIPKSASVSFSK